MKNDSKLETLTQAYLDGSLTEANAERLNAILAEDREARFVFAETLNLDSAIAATAAGWESESESEFPRRNRKWGGWPSLAACALILIAGSWLWHGASQPREVREYATVERGVGVESLPAGMKLHGGMHTITAGTVELLTALGVQIIIEAPAEFRFESSQRLHMMRGRLAAEVPPAAKGFTVITPTGDAVDLGTRFGVDVPEEGAAEIHVFEGEVIAKTSGTAEQLSLRAGDALAMNRGVSSARDLRSSAFIQPDEMGELKAAQESGQRARSDAALAKLKDDPAKIAVLDFESGPKYPGVYRPVQGRWPGSRAPEFIDAGDHLKLEVGGDRTWPQLTLAAWVRLDQLGALYQSLLHADGWEGDNFGLVHWMVNEAATMRFAMWGNTLAPGSDEKYYYPDSLTPVSADQGRWVHLATVYDSTKRTVRFYHNGRFDKETRQTISYPARLGAIQIGNWNQDERKLSGRVDELILLGRAMADEEVQALFEAGNPYPKLK
jgi:hypothetical protein